jgi:gas vesicle protein
MARQNGSELAWFFAGVALGAAGALLSAPQTGEEARRKLLWQAEKGRDRLFEVSRTAADRGRDLAAEAAESGRRAYQRSRDIYRQGRNLAEDTAAEVADAVSPEPASDASNESAARA